MNRKDDEHNPGYECDECGKHVSKICRVYKGRRYCATCYARIFKHRMCPRCGNLARLPKDDPEAICLTCQSNKPCVRCGKTDYRTGLITPYGPVCNACAPYFRKAEPCEVCGRLSTRLSRVFRLGHEYRVCPKCARADYGTCEACKRYRLLRRSPDNRLLCRKCLEKGEIICPKCGELMPAGHGSKCRKCYWKDLLEKRIDMDSAIFSSPKMVTYFRAFGQWLGRKVGEHKAALTIHKYLQLFTDIERRWRTIPEYSEMLKYFGAKYLRRFLLPIRWMEESGIVVEDNAAKQNDSERRRIEATIEKIPEGLYARTIAEGYHEEMIEKLRDGKTTLRSIRMALTPAVALLLKASDIECMPPDQNVLNKYLEESSGQRAAVSGFVRYLREKHGAEVTLPKNDSIKVERYRKKKLESEMLSLLREGDATEEFKRRWMSVALKYFHGLPKKVGLEVLDKDIEVANAGLIVTWQNKQYWLPVPVLKPSK